MRLRKLKELRKEPDQGGNSAERPNRSPASMLKERPAIGAAVTTYLVGELWLQIGQRTSSPQRLASITTECAHL
jgi:hypothetical protein